MSRLINSLFLRMSSTWNPAWMSQAIHFLFLVWLIIWAPNPLRAQTQNSIFNHAELELNLGTHQLGFYRDAPEWIGNSMLANVVQLGLTLPIAPNSALIAQAELQRQYSFDEDYYCDVGCGSTVNVRTMDESYLVKPFLGLGLRHYFMSSGMWVQASYVASYAPFYSGSGKNGHYYYYYSNGTYRSTEYYTLTTFKSVPVFQGYLRLSLGYQFRPFRKSGMGFGLGTYCAYGKNAMAFDVTRAGNLGISHSNSLRTNEIITQVDFGFSASFFVPLRELRKRK